MKNKFLLFFVVVISITANAQKKDKPTPELKEVYFMNRSNEVITEAITLDEKYVYLVIESLNAKGEDITITFSEDDAEVIYKNKYIGPNDSLNVKIRKDFQKLKLTLYYSHNRKHVHLKTGKKKRKIATIEKVRK